MNSANFEPDRRASVPAAAAAPEVKAPGSRASVTLATQRPDRPSQGGTNRPAPVFRWQAALILLPVIVLAGFSLVSLRQDRLLVEQEARERAGEFAAELADRLYVELNHIPLPALAAASSDQRASFQIDSSGALLSPPPYDPGATPRPFELTALEAELRERWTAAEQAEFGNSPTATIATAWQRVLQTQLPPRWNAAATYNLGLALARNGARAEALATWQRLFDTAGAATTESGFPYATLARWQALQLAQTAGATRASLTPLIQGLCSNLVYQPSPLTAILLERLTGPSTPPGDAANLDGAHWKWLWRQHQQARALCQTTLREWRASLSDSSGPNDSPLPTNAWLSLPRQLWVHAPLVNPAGDLSRTAPTNDWLVLASTGPVHDCVALSEAAVRETIRRVLSNTPRLPAYFEASFEIASRVMHAPGRPALATREAASSSRPGERPWVRASLHLSDPSALFARQRTRSLWLGALIVMATLVAGVGLLVAQRAFARQLRLNEMKSRFVSSVSHELRAPIASVRLLAESLDRGTVSDEAKRRDYFRLIVQECRRLSSLIENVLDFSRIDQGRKRYEFEPTDLRALVMQTVNLMGPYAAERQVRLEVTSARADALPAHADVDGKAIQQALVNLIDNAIKHAPGGSAVEIDVAMLEDKPAPAASSVLGEPPNPPPTRLRLCVSDHGPGIPAMEFERIFEPFYRRGSELRRETPGIGIGLSIVKHIVAAHHGRVWVESELGQGSRFVLELPLQHADPEAAPGGPANDGKVDHV